MGKVNGQPSWLDYSKTPLGMLRAIHEGSGDRVCEPGVGGGYVLRADDLGFCVCGDYHGLVQSRGAAWRVSA